MSTRTPSESSRGPVRAASTTYVAPCSRCAGPNASPWKLWAIIMWSRTVTVNTSLLRHRCLVGIDDAPTQAHQGAVGQLGHHGRQLLEARLARQQHVERRVAEQLEREGQPLRAGTPPTPRRRHLA